MRNYNITMDFIRGIAAQLVLFSHSYPFLFSQDKDEINTISERFLYKFISILSGFGHSAVVVFFVLSGYLVGHDVFVKINNQSFSPKFYIVSRLARLYCVVLPGLFVCAALDYASFHYGYGDSILSASVPFYPSWWVSANTFSAQTFACNLLFFQMSECYQYGTNLSLWSLSNELFYYALFPSLLLIIHAGSIRIRIIAALVFGFFLVEMLQSSSPNDPDRVYYYLEGFIIWGMGAFLPEIFNRVPGWITRPWSILIFILAAIVLRKIGSEFLQDLSVAILIMFAIYHTYSVDTLLMKWPKGCIKIVKLFSNYSFSLYFIHLPVIFALSSFISMFSDKFFYSIPKSLIYCSLIIVVNLVAFGFYWLFERHYPWLRNLFMRRPVIIPIEAD
jgi:peptidoglycan/LPS O-acetylase OafA/YrhL